LAAADFAADALHRGQCHGGDHDARQKPAERERERPPSPATAAFRVLGRAAKSPVPRPTRLRMGIVVGAQRAQAIGA